jgi:hypothetical protein
VLAGLDALAPQPADFLAHIRRIFRLTDVDEQLPELSHKAVHFADHLGVITQKEKKKNDFLSYTHIIDICNVIHKWIYIRAELDD